MLRRFVTKRRKFNYKIIIYLILILLSFNITLKLLLNKKKSNKDFLINVLLDEGLKKNHMFWSNLNKKITEPKEIIYRSLNKIGNNLSNVDNFKYEENNTSYIEDPNPLIVKNPIVYIYNTHQTEEYSIKNPFDYSVKPNVMMASYILREKLNKLGIPSIVETANIKDYLKNNKLNYSYSYIASRHFIEEIMKKHNSIKYFIDIHRDSIGIDKSLYVKKNKKYARILFIVGLDHKNYKDNLKTVTDINEMIEKDYLGISRGISKKTGPNVNGIYNQDISKNVILIEIGGLENEIEEVYNTIEVLSEYIAKYIKEKS